MTFRNLRNKALFGTWFVRLKKTNKMKKTTLILTILALTTASGKTHTVRLLKQSDIFGH